MSPFQTFSLDDSCNRIGRVSMPRPGKLHLLKHLEQSNTDGLEAVAAAAAWEVRPIHFWYLGHKMTPFLVTDN